jgi:hypothetical protein
MRAAARLKKSRMRLEGRRATRSMPRPAYHIGNRSNNGRADFKLTKSFNGLYG